MVSITHYGGAREIGASFHVSRFGDKFFGVDCGLRPNVHPRDLDYIKKISPDIDACERLDYFILTHGHLDHVGATPLLFRKFPNVKAFATAPTKLISFAQWNETPKIVKKNRAPLLFESYEAKDAFHKINIIVFGEVINFGDVTVRVIPNGHILGSVAVEFTYQNKKILDLGNISVEDQETVKGVDLREFSKVNCLISEATYLGKERPSRDVEKEKFLKDINSILAAGKSQILIAAFSIGRAQEIYEILRKSNIWSKAKIFIDGLARDMSDIYLKFLPPGICNEMQKHYVHSKFHRHDIFRQKPVIVIASSGMLEGVAVAYAEKWISNKRNAILFTGYLDPDSQGYDVWSAKDRDAVLLKDKFGGFGSYIKKCFVDQYQFSAHADDEQLLNIREITSPELTIFNHGDPECMDRTIITEMGKGGSIIAPPNGEEIKI